MIKKIFRVIFTILGLLIGFVLADGIRKSAIGNEYLTNIFFKVSFYVILIAVFGIILFILSPFIYKSIRKLITFIEKGISKLSPSEIIFGAGGAIVALVLALVITLPLSSFLSGLNEMLGPIVSVIINIIAMVIGADIAVKKREDITGYFENFRKNQSKEKKTRNSSNKKNEATPKVLDTSVIIDGRIFDLCQTGFIEGALVIPTFVLDELRHISDCSDSLKRTRGRRGLDILNKIQKELPIEVIMWEGDFPEIAEVDIKLLKLAQKLNGKVVTNDYNLNKVAEFQGVPVLNINELANAIKPVVLPGEEMTLTVVKDGKESGQGVAYLDDGTMIVVEGGRKYMGKEITVVVTSVLQTAAGRMIFAKYKS
ncbi:TPA: PIN/TRAM domain-containing protein [Clostridium perfringens]|uniref:PIN/TRAM domain-containing protein n=1 Tax=Clostridium perfringens TaxID=1502 RepID=UPI00115829B3|nr:PIN/TRAM domain-containing protein [Clostridium perfringens]EGT0695101.1 PIN/TRAM domain-containing protein [Clostridium perfringens]EGT2191674.1 TRAM domain-containing protein [Clostridium perfringens]EGT3603072.1 PIN/TRAM domain-containing protein [Clostridium perfringens]EHA0994947.1 PIN/TRAM domain-containing protein [Clostridium perfringens]EHA1185798.1 PIN/TRAM domain-containing protein [Clostridium perfringens]